MICRKVSAQLGKMDGALHTCIAARGRGGQWRGTRPLATGLVSFSPFLDASSCCTAAMSISRKENGGQEPGPLPWDLAHCVFFQIISNSMLCCSLSSLPLLHSTCSPHRRDSISNINSPPRWPPARYMARKYLCLRPQSPCRRGHHASSSSRPAKSTLLRSPDERARLPRCSLQIAETPATGSSLELAAPSAPQSPPKMDFSRSHPTKLLLAPNARASACRYTAWAGRMKIFFLHSPYLSFPVSVAPDLPK